MSEESLTNESLTVDGLELDIAYHTSVGSEDHARFRQAANWVANRFQLTRFVVSIAIIDDAAIQKLNCQHLDHDWPTDVISLVYEQGQAAVEGEVIASAETAERVCATAGWSANDELLLYVVHGLLHLAGLDDIDAESRRQMRQAEQECLLALGVAAADHVARSSRIFN
jgi:probable rRNA maturation factor